MDESRPPAMVKRVDDRVRELGFDPRQLTPREREELVEIHERYPDEVLVAPVR